MQNHELESFDDLLALVDAKARSGEIFFRMDIKPPFSDTPENWEQQLETAFTATQNR